MKKSFLLLYIEVEYNWLIAEASMFNYTELEKWINCGFFLHLLKP